MCQFTPECLEQIFTKIYETRSALGEFDEERGYKLSEGSNGGAAEDRVSGKSEQDIVGANQNKSYQSQVASIAMFKVAMKNLYESVKRDECGIVQGVQLHHLQTQHYRRSV